MPVVLIDERTRGDLAPLLGFGDEVFPEFLKLTLEFIKKGSNTKIIDRAAAKLKTHAEQLRHGIEALALILTEWTKAGITAAELEENVGVLKLPAGEFAGLLQRCYTANATIIREAAIPTDGGFGLRKYRDLSWRLDVEVASRCARATLNPIFLLRLDTVEPPSASSEPSGAGAESAGVMRKDKVVSRFLEVDPVSLKHITSELENALAESRSAAARRVMRNIK